jgi:hypothetical protein
VLIQALILQLAATANAQAGGSARPPCVAAAEEGSAHEVASRLSSAAVAYRRCIAEPTCSSVVSRDCSDGLARVEARAPTVVFAVTDGRGRDAVGAAVVVDGVEVRPGIAVALDPGAHVVTARTSGAIVRKEIVAAEGEKLRHVSLEIVSQDERDASPRSAAAPLPWPAIGLASAGAVVGAAGAGLYFGVKTDRDACSPLCTDDTVDSLRARLLTSQLTLAAGGALIAAGAVWLVLSLGSPRTAARAALPLRGITF